MYIYIEECYYKPIFTSLQKYFSTHHEFQLNEKETTTKNDEKIQKKNKQN